MPGEKQSYGHSEPAWCVKKSVPKTLLLFKRSTNFSIPPTVFTAIGTILWFIMAYFPTHITITAGRPFTACRYANWGLEQKFLQ